MVGIFVGGGFGLARGSANLLGGRGQIGASSMGRAGENVFINAANGNLVLQQSDEFLVGRGVDTAVNRTYNSLAQFSDDYNGDRWRLSSERRLHSWSATPNVGGAVVHRRGADGADIAYTYDAARGLYIGRDDAGAHDTLQNVGHWIWTDGDTQVKEVYDVNGNLIYVTDADGNSTNYAYQFINEHYRLHTITDTAGNFVRFDWSGENLMQIVTSYTAIDPVTGTLSSKLDVSTRYEYDGLNRLTKVIVDLSPEDGSIADGRVYETRYGYVGSSKLIGWIEQTDGSRLEFSYDAQDRVTAYYEYDVGGATRWTQINYGATYTVVIDPQGNGTIMHYDANQRLVEIDEPSAVNGGNPRYTYFDYNQSSGDEVGSIRVFDGNTQIDRVAYSYDANGNVIQQVDGSMRTINRTYGSRNELLTETSFTGLDHDGLNGALPSGTMTTRYVYDAENHLRFAISAEGKVTEYLYDGSDQKLATTTNGVGNLTRTIVYNNLRYPVSGLAETAAPNEAQMMDWRSTGNMPDKTDLLRTDYAYDFRGNIALETRYRLLNSNGDGAWTADNISQTTYVYDHAGNLLSKLLNDGSLRETYAYDGMGRMIWHTDATGVGTWTSYLDSQNRTVTTLANGSTRTAVYNRAGELMTTIESNSGPSDPMPRLSMDLWGYGGVSATPAGLVDGATAMQYTVQNSGGWSGIYTNHQVAAGESVSFSVSLLAVAGSSTTQLLGIYGNSTGWGADCLSTARIVSGPGKLVRSAWSGGLWQIEGLSTTEPTRIEIIRNFEQAETLSTIIYTDLNDGYRAGQSVITAAPVVNRMLPSIGIVSSSIGDWSSGGIIRTSAGTINGEAAYKLAVETQSSWSGTSQGFFAQAGDTVTATVSLKGADGGSSASFGIYSYINHWGPNGYLSTARILSGPGILSQEGGLWHITGLSDTVETRIEITRTLEEATNVGIYLYPNLPQGWQAGQAIIAGAAAATITPGSATQYRYDNLGRLRVTIDPLGVRTFFLYDKQGRKVADISDAGAVTEYKYDAADRVIAVVGYATTLTAAQVNSLQNGYNNPTTIDLADIRPAAHAKDRWQWNIYDKAGLLIETIDAAGAATTYQYDGAGRLIKSGRYYHGLLHLDATVLERMKVTPPTAFIQPAWDSSVDRMTRNFYDADGLLIGTIDEDGYLSEYIYDAAGRKVETVRYANAVAAAYMPIGAFDTLTPGTFDQVKASVAPHSTDIHNYWIYDGRSNLIATIDGEGNVTRFQYDARGNVIEEVRGQQVAANTRYTMATLPVATSGTFDVTKYQRDGNGNVTLRQKLLWGGNVENSFYSYDAMGNLVSQTTNETLSSETRTQSWRYDGKGRLTGTLGGRGSVALAAFGPNATTQQINSIYAQYGTTYRYDAADRLIATLTPDSSNPGAQAKTVYYYDGDGQLRYEVNALGETTEHRYNRWGELMDIVDFATRIAAGTVANLRGGLVTAEISGAITSIAASDWHWQYVYDNRGLLVGEYDPSYYSGPAIDSYTAYYYNNFGDRTQSIAAAGVNGSLSNVTESGYYLRGYKYWDRAQPAGSSTGSVQATYSVDAFGRAHATYTNNLDWRRHWNRFDRANRVIHEFDNREWGTVYGYDPRNNLISSTDRAGNTTTHSYDPFNRNVTTTTAEGIVSRVTQNAFGQTIQIVDGATRSISYAYDKDGNLVSTTDAAGTTQNSYDNANRLIETTDARGVKVRYSYDAVGRVLTETRDVGGLNYVTTYSYDAFGQVLTTTDVAAGTTTQFSYDLEGQQSSVIRNVGGLNFETRYQYRADGKVISMIDAFGTADARTTTYDYDSMGRLLSETIDPAGLAITTRYAYDVNGNIVEITDANGNKTRLVYDKENRETQRISAEGEVIETGYDADGRIAYTRAYATRLNSNQLAAFSTLGNEWQTLTLIGGTTLRIEKQSKNPNDGVITASLIADLARDNGKDQANRSVYDKDGRRAYTVDGMGYFTRFAYDGAGNVIKVIHYADAVGVDDMVSKAGLDSLLGPVSSPPSTAAVTTFGYDAANRLINSSDAEGGVESYQYDAAGNRTRVTNKLGGVTDYSYDNLGRIVTETVQIATHRYDANSNLIAASGVTTRYHYNALGNVTRKIEAEGLQEQRITDYEYDKLGRLTKTVSPAVMVVEPSSGTNITVQTEESYSYDLVGNLTQITNALGAKTSYYYDKSGRKIAAITATGSYQSWTYDGIGQVRTERTYGTRVAVPSSASSVAPAAPGGAYRETEFYYDKNGRIVERRTLNVQTGSFDGSQYTLAAPQTLSVKTVYDAFGNVAQQIDANGGIVWSWYDKVGNKTHQVDQENYLTIWSYDANGNAVWDRRYATRVSGTLLLASPPAETGALEDRHTSFTYDRNGNRTSETRHNIIASSVDANGAVTTGYAAAIIYYGYNALGQVSFKMEANGDRTDYQYDNQGRLVTEQGATIPSGVRPTTSFIYDGLGNLTRQLVAGDAGVDRVTQYKYGAGGRLEWVRDASGQVTRSHYDRVGNLTGTLTEHARANGVYLGSRVGYQYDAEGRQIAEQHYDIDAARGWDWGILKATEYNAYGEVALTRANGSAQEYFEYDNAGRLIKSSAGDGTWKAMVYDKAGNVTLTLTSAGSRNLGTESYASILASVPAVLAGSDISLIATVAVYDKRNMAISSREMNRSIDNGAGTGTNHSQTLISSRGYNAFGETLSETNARGFTTSYSYNTMGRMIQRTLPQTNVVSESGVTTRATPIDYFYYDVSGRLVGTRDANGNLTTRTLLAGTGHGGSEALVTAEFKPADGVSRIAYDIFGDARTITNSAGHVTTQQFDAMGRVIKVTKPSGLTDHYGYDGLGQRTTHWLSKEGAELYGAGVRETTDYDYMGRVIATKNFAGDLTTTTYAWHTDGNGIASAGGWVKTVSSALDRYSASDAIYATTEKSDTFGRVLSRTDMGGTAFTMSYNVAGQLVQQTSTAGQNMTYGYHNSGQIAWISDNVNVTTLSSFTYDANGNRVYERVADYYAERRNQRASYDELDRMTLFTDNGAAAGGTVSVTNSYDAASNIRQAVTNVPIFNNNGALSYQRASSHWYRYDSQNRMVLAKGMLINGQIVRGTDGVAISYNNAGQRATETRNAWLQATIYDPNPYNSGPPYYNEIPIDGGDADQQMDISFDGERRQIFAYDADGRLLTVATAVSDYSDNYNGTVTVLGLGAAYNSATYSYDALGRVVAYNEGYQYSRYGISYDNRGNVVSEQTTLRRGDGATINTSITNYYLSGSGVLATNYATVTQSKYGTPTTTYYTSTTNSYRWGDGPQVSTISYNNGQGLTTVTVNSFDENGFLTSSYIGDATNRTVNYINDAQGQILSRRAYGNAPVEQRYFMNGVQMGVTGNDGAAYNQEQGHEDYATSLLNRVAAPPATPGPFANGGTYGNGFSDFEMAFDPINATNGAGGGGSYTVRAGDSLQSIAQSVWGDASLWYKLAEMNGINANSGLATGQILTLPSGVQNHYNNASTFRPYDPSEAIGDISPTTPAAVKPPKKKNKCGVFGQILMVVVAVAVSAWLGPQMIGAFQGMFVGGAVAGTAAYSAGMVAGSIVGGALAGAASSIVIQGFGVATGIQDKFSWKAVGMAAIGGGVGGGLSSFNAFGSSGLGSLTKVANDVVRGALSNTLTQGIGRVTGLQSSFNWAGVAIGGVVAGVGGIASRALPGRAIGTAGTEGYQSATIYNEALSGAAAALAGAGAKSIIDGTSFGDNVLATLPDVIGSTIGRMIVGSGRPQVDKPRVGRAEAGMQEANYWHQKGGGPNGGQSSGEPVPAEPQGPDIIVYGNRMNIFEKAISRALEFRPSMILYNSLDRISTTLTYLGDKGKQAVINQIANRNSLARYVLRALPVGHALDGYQNRGLIQADGAVLSQRLGASAEQTFNAFNGVRDKISAPFKGTMLETPIEILLQPMDQKIGFINTVNKTVASLPHAATHPMDIITAPVRMIDAVMVADQTSARVYAGRAADKISSMTIRDTAQLQGTIQAHVTMLIAPEAALARGSVLRAATDDAFIGPRIGVSGYKTSAEFAEAVGAKYQGFVNDAYIAGHRLEAQGLLRGNPNTRLGDFVDRFSARDLRAYLRSEGIAEGSSGLVRMNRWLRDPAGSSLYVKPDVYIPAAGRIYDATIGYKAYNSTQITRFGVYSDGSKITLVRPDGVGGSYSIVPQ